MKICTKCGQSKPYQQFAYRKDREYYDTVCRSCRNAQKQRWKKANPDSTRQSNQKSQRPRHERLKREVIEAYGGQCECCQESDMHFLTIDHKNGVPARHRQADGRRVSGTALLYLLRAEGYPDDCRVLCWNCNCSYGYYGFCPHQPHRPEDRRYQ